MLLNIVDIIIYYYALFMFLTRIKKLKNKMFIHLVIQQIKKMIDNEIPVKTL